MVSIFNRYNLKSFNFIHVFFDWLFFIFLLILYYCYKNFINTIKNKINFLIIQLQR